MESREQDFTQGSVVKHLIKFGLPLLAANILQYCYQAADMIVVGQVMGNDGLVAISNASMISFCIGSFAIGMTGGGTVVLARCKGAGDAAGQRTASAAVFVLSALCALAVTVPGIMFVLPVFTALGVPGPSLDEAVSYMVIVSAGSIFTFGYNAACSLMRALGDARGPLAFIAVASVVNVVLDIAFVGVLGWEVAGAAWATVIAQALSCALALRHLFARHPSARPRFGFGRAFARSAAEVLKVGVPSASQMIVVNISYLLVTGMLNAYGTDVAAASGIGLKISTFAGLPCWAMGQAATAMTSQNAGAQRVERMRSIVRASCGISVAIIALIAVATQAFAYDLALLFGASGTEAIETTVLYLRITCSVNSAFYALMYCFDSFALGSGSPNLALVNAVLDAVAIRFGLAWVLGTVFGMGFVGVYLAQALSPVLPVLVGWAYYLRGTWKVRLANPPDTKR
ncbi:MATE family efflux transporter [Raoultibacter timonensis]|uniref:MATE family efflux transporter n=1 Tax=Raoultibacter timonensis TaxID=1907662 RepID=A0ABN6MFQ7_9ACTN|nr:MATE family efflux transporter [Raoultibacter timonensis]BDE95461.1 MATE family efflux transporter [Raoultibacter timonensis]BDF50065.1 MATE family efflux transporter [Raoultibacter timonensis]